ncbi:MAG: hypothetical protein NXI07_12545, partial [bacterium]|nr:hypothetical protein [bacterium]
MPIRTRTILSMKPVAGLGVGALLLFAGSAANAQNALGDGNALDANPGQYGSGNYARPSLVDELRFRNSIATGNAPGGLSFRGDLGYRSAGEFTGELGSDSLFAFRRDSLYSGLAGMGIRGTDALQYQFALTTGSAPPRNLIGNLSYTRDDAYSTGSQFQSRQGTQNTGTLGIDREQSDLDPMGQALSTAASITGFDSGSMMGTLRSSATYNTTSTMQPSLLSVYTEGIDRRPVGLVASPLLGITPTPLKSDERAANPLVSRAGGEASGEGVPGAIPSARMTTSYDALVEQMRERVQAMRDESMVNGTGTTIEPSESNDAWLVRQMEEIRRNLYGEQPARAGEESEDPNAETGTGAGGDEQPAGDDAGDGSPTTPIVSIP